MGQSKAAFGAPPTQRVRSLMAEMDQLRLQPLDERVDHTRGPVDGRAILEYGDSEFPYARQAFRETEQVRRRLAGVRFAFRHFRLSEIHSHARAASPAAEAAALQHRFWDRHGLLVHRQLALD
jgi:protein-disulfide isomerase